MSIKHSIASRNRWKNVSPEERSKRMSKCGKASAAKRTPEQMKKQIKLMVKSRLKKQCK